MISKSILLLLGVSVISAQKWVLTWSDEFNGDSLDRNKWNIDVGNGGFGNNELEYYTDRSNNVRVSGGYLYLTAQKEYYGGNEYTSGKINSYGHYNPTYGWFETRAKLPKGQGMWPAFWMLGTNIGTVGWPECGEIDIMEWIGKDPDNVHGSTHATGQDRTSTYWGNSWSDAFHTFAVNWQPDRIEFYADGNNYFTAWQSESGGHWPFTHDFYMILNLAVGGNWPGNPDASTQFPQNYIIDYVRVYEIDWSAEEVVDEIHTMDDLPMDESFAQ